MATWDEIKRLAADFQRAQLSETTQRLSERNCIEIVQKLVENQLIEVIHTLDGKQYLTPQEVLKEIEEELIVHGGRISLTDLQQNLKVDYSYIETKANLLVSTSHGIKLVLAQLINQNYLDNLADEVNDQLQKQGHINIADLTVQYDLPAEFLGEAIRSRIGSHVVGKVDTQDERIIYTPAFISRHRARIVGAFTAVTTPLPVSNVINKYKLKENIFFTILNQLMTSGRLAGSLSGGKTSTAVFVPDIYTRAQNQWVDSFYQQNAYLEYDAVQRLGISDAKSFIKKRYKSDKLYYLSTCACSEGMIERIQADVEEAINTTGWADVMSLVPTVFNSSDASQIVTKLTKSVPSYIVYCDVIITTRQFVQKCNEPFQDIMLNKARQDASKHPALLSSNSKTSDTTSVGKQDKKEQRRKKATGGSKAGAGGQGRETKTKSLKKKGQRGRDLSDDSDDDTTGSRGSNTKQGGGGVPEIDFFSIDEIHKVLVELPHLKDCSDSFTYEVAEQLYRPLHNKYQEVVRSVYLETSGSVTSQARRKAHTQLQDKVTEIWASVAMFEKATKFFSDDVNQQLTQHLLRTLCTDITQMIVHAVADDNMIAVPDDTAGTIEARSKLISSFPAGKTANILTKLNMALNGKDLEEFSCQLNNICDPSELGLVLKKQDKKKERQIAFSHKQQLCQQLRDESDPPVCLHLACVLLFYVYTQTMIHAPGRCVPAIIDRLIEYVPDEQYQCLHQCQELIMKQLKHQRNPSDDCDATELESQLKDLIPQVKDIALNAKRANAASNLGE